jgi:quercetin dioxygenase-like cupin family protein
MDQQNNHRRPYALKAEEGWRYRFGIDFLVKAGEVRPGGSVAVVEYASQAGEEPGSHTHDTEDEMFYVIEGAITFECGSETFDLEKGGFIFLPRGIKHSYTIHGPHPVRLLVISSPVRDGASEGWGGFVADLETGQGELVEKPKHLA